MNQVLSGDAPNLSVERFGAKTAPAQALQAAQYTRSRK